MTRDTTRIFRPLSIAPSLVAIAAVWQPDPAFSQQISEESNGSSGWTRTSNPPVNRGAVGNSGQSNQRVTEASEKASTKWAGLALPAGVLIGAQALDVHSTYRAIESGRGREGNPIMDVGDGGRIAIKAATTAVAIAVAAKLHGKHPRLAKATLWTLSSVTLAVAGHNYRLAAR